MYNKLLQNIINKMFKSVDSTKNNLFKTDKVDNNDKIKISYRDFIVIFLILRIMYYR